MMPPISSTGMNTAISDTVIDTMVKPISRGARDGRFEPGLAEFEVTRDVLDHHDRIIDDETDGDRQPHQRHVVEAVAKQIHDRERRDQRHRNGEARDQRRARIAQEGEDHQHDEDDGDQHGDLNAVHRCADGLRPVADDAAVRAAGGSEAVSAGSRSLIRRIVSTTLKPGSL